MNARLLAILLGILAAFFGIITSADAEHGEERNKGCLFVPVCALKATDVGAL